MTTEDFIITRFCRVQEVMGDKPKHRQANLDPREIVTLGRLFALKGVDNRAFDRWRVRDFKHLFPKLPERTRLFCLFATHPDWTDLFLAEPSLLSVIDSDGIELIHPIREGRSEQQIGRKGLSNRRWMVGSKLCFLLNHLGQVIGWDGDTANGHDTTFPPLIQRFEDRTVVFSDFGFQAKAGDPANLKVGEPFHHNERRIVETVLSMLTTICHFKKIMHRVWDYLKARLAFTMALFNLRVGWDGFHPDPDGFVHLSIAAFSL